LEVGFHGYIRMVPKEHLDQLNDISRYRYQKAHLQCVPCSLETVPIGWFYSTKLGLVSCRSLNQIRTSKLPFGGVMKPCTTPRVGGIAKVVIRSPNTN